MDFEHSPAAQFETNDRGVVRRANRAAATLFGVSEDALSRLRLLDIVALEHAEALRDHLERACAGRSIIDTVFALERPVAVRMITARDPSDVRSVLCSVLVEVEDLMQEQRRLHLLSEVGLRLVGFVDHEHVVADAIRVFVPATADLCSIDLVDEEGVLRHADAGPGSSSLARWLEERIRMQGTPIEPSSPQARALAERRAILVPEPDQPSSLALPLEARDRAIGVVTLVRFFGAYSPRDVAFAQSIARAAALAIDGARLHRQSQRAIGVRDNLLAAVAHDLRNPIGAILLRAGEMLDVPATNERRKTRRGVEGIQRAALRMQRLVSDLVDSASIESDRLAVAKGSCSIGDVLAEAVEVAQPGIRAKNITLAISGGVDAVLDCDAGRIVQLIGNLLENAIKHTPRSGKIVIAVALEDGVRISITDTGPGIPADQLTKVFDRYWQQKRGDQHGLGLGLWIAKGIVEAHGGRIWAESTPGSGATFTFHLPTPEKSTADKQVLVVDDDPDAALALAAACEMLGYESAIARDGAEALRWIETRGLPSLILLDLEMPGMDGATFLGERERRPALRKVPVIVVSGTPRAELERPSLTKPISYETLASAIGSVRAAS